MTQRHKDSISKSKNGIKCDPDVVKRRAKTFKYNMNKMSKQERSERYGLKGETNGFYQRNHTEQSKQKIRETIGDSRKGSKNGNACPVELFGKEYGTKKECYTSLAISKKKLNQILGDLKMKTSKGDIK